jgi:pyridinium-3,5-bisthiocarboxylic acid mononucleotide nickel chelatase
MGETILYYDCFAGISGDMHLAAMVDLGVPQEYLREELSRLGLPGFTLRFTRDARKGITGTRADVEVEARHGGHGHEHRAFADIRALISQSGLAETVKTRSLAIFLKLAEAEAIVHGVPVEEVHFHEVGAVDSIVDIVAAALCLEYLKPDRIYASSVELGAGFVKSQHGLLPVPAPATALLLTGVPVKTGAVPFEMTTPTGAAILASNVQSFTDRARFTIRKVAYGIGHRDVEIPNVLRVILAEAQDAPSVEACILECNIDDMSPELHGHVAELLFSAGASDVYFTPIIMKKSRPAVMLSVLCNPDVEQRLSELILRETTTFGLRRVAVQKTALDREIRTVATRLGDVRVKIALRDGKRLKVKPEYEDCRLIAQERNMPLREVYEIVQKEIG